MKTHETNTEERRVRPITSAYIADAAKSRDGKRALCAEVVSNLRVSGNAGPFGYNDAGVYWMPADGRIVLVFSWTLFGTFIACVPAMDVTTYVKREELT